MYVPPHVSSLWIPGYLDFIQTAVTLFYVGISGKPKTNHFCIQTLDCL